MACKAIPKTIYRQKDFLEKTFDTLKHEIDGKRLRAHTADALMGQVFLKFLSLIVYAGITNTMRTHQMFRRYSVRELLYELKQLRIVEMNNGTHVLTECSKRQTAIKHQDDFLMKRRISLRNVFMLIR